MIIKNLGDNRKFFLLSFVMSIIRLAKDYQPLLIDFHGQVRDDLNVLQILRYFFSISSDKDCFSSQ